MKRIELYTTDYENYEDFVREEYPDIEEDSQAYWGIISEETQFCYECELDNMKAVDISEGMIIIANLGLWYGLKRGYKEVRGYTVKDALEQCSHRDYMDIDFGINESNDLYYRGHHHDGTNHMVVRRWRKGLSDEAKDRLMDSIYEGKEINIDWYTRPIGKEIKAYYGIKEA
jgi:hypothetical protein